MVPSLHMAVFFLKLPFSQLPSDSGEKVENSKSFVKKKAFNEDCAEALPLQPPFIQFCPNSGETNFA